MYVVLPMMMRGNPAKESAKAVVGPIDALPFFEGAPLLDPFSFEDGLLSLGDVLSGSSQSGDSSLLELGRSQSILAIS